MPIADFLNNVSYDGVKLSAFEADLGGGAMTDLNSPGAYAQMLKTMLAPSGLLSNKYQSTALAGMVSGLSVQKEQGQEQMMAQLAADGVSGSTAMRMLAEGDRQFQSAALGAANQLETARGQNEADAILGVTNALATIESQQKQMELQDYWNKKFYKQAESANKFSKIMGIASLALGLPSALTTAASAIGGWFGKGGGEAPPQMNFGVGGGATGGPAKLPPTLGQYASVNNYSYQSPATVGMSAGYATGSPDIFGYAGSNYGNYGGYGGYGGY